MSVIMFYSGCFTRQIFLQGLTLAEVERRLGFHTGRLSNGAKFVAATQLPAIDGFDLAGYTQVASHHTTQQYGNLNNPIGKSASDAYRIQKQNAMREWSLTGSNRLIKVIPATAHDKNLDPDIQYPPGAGIPQWVVKHDHKIPCKLLCDIKDYPLGKFIPDEGFTAVKYG